MLPWVNYTNKMFRLFLHHRWPHWKVGTIFSDIYGVAHAFCLGRICIRSNCSVRFISKSTLPFCFPCFIQLFVPTAPNIVKCTHCNSVSFAKLHKWNVWIISPLLYLKLNIFMHSTEISKSLLGFQIKIWDNQQFIDLFWGTSLLTQLISTEFLISI